MLLSSDVVFDGPVPELAAIANAMNRRTGLTTSFRKHAKHDLIVIRCREVRPAIDDMSIHDHTVRIEQFGWYGVYFFRELVGTLVDLGGRPIHGSAPDLPMRWRDLPWHVRMIEKHPFTASLFWLALQLRAFVRRPPE
jgi:hypothetical protein